MLKSKQLYIRSHIALGASILGVLASLAFITTSFVFMGQYLVKMSKQKTIEKNFTRNNSYGSYITSDQYLEYQKQQSDSEKLGIALAAAGLGAAAGSIALAKVSSKNEDDAEGFWDEAESEE